MKVDKRYWFYIIIIVAFMISASLIVLANYQTDETLLEQKNNAETNIDPTFIMIPANESDNLPEGSYKVVQITPEKSESVTTN